MACGTISPMMTMASVAPMTATSPEVRVSRRMVNVLFTFEERGLKTDDAMALG
jgi:hypothetical protein